MRLTAGTMLGPYEVLSPLGAGGMGEVYRAHDARLRRDVAIKVLPQSAPGGMEWERFQREARAASALNHPNICTILDVGEVQGQPYLVMELLEGETLQQRLRRGPLPETVALPIAMQIADALSVAHAKVILHRDIKPGNIMLVGRNHVKLLDFGLAKQTAGTESDVTLTMAPETVAGSVVGTPAYLAPEILRGERADARTDIWAFGIVLCQMLTGSLPFQGNTAFELSASILKEPLPPLTGVSDKLRQIVEACLAKDRSNRTASAEIVRTQLESPQGAPVIISLPPPPPISVREKPVRTGRRVWMWIFVAPLAARVGYSTWRKITEDPPVKLLSTGDPASLKTEANREYELAVTAIRVSNDLPRGLAASKRALEIDPTFSPARLNHCLFTAISLWTGVTGDTSLLFTAEQELGQVEREAPELGGLPFVQAAVYFIQGRRERVPLEKLDQFIREHEDRAESVWRVTLYRFAGQTEKAQSLLRKILDHAPLFAAAQTIQAEIQRQEGDAAGAEEVLLRILDQGPDNVIAQFSLILAYVDQGKTMQARQLLDRSRRMNPDNYLLKTMEVFVLASEGKKKEALSALDADLQTYAATILQVTVNMAEIYASMGETDEAVEWVGKAVRGGDERIGYMRRAPRLASLRRDPRFITILRSVEDRRR